MTDRVVTSGHELRVGMRLLTGVRALLATVILATLLSGIACERQASGNKLTVVTTIFPLADFVKNVAGDKVDVVTLLRAGDSPHTYEPSSRDMKAVARATLLVVNGAGLDFWVERLKTAASDNLVVVDTSAVLAEEGLLLSGDGHDDGGTNPHFWLDPVLAQKQVEAIATALIAADLDNKDFYLENTADYVSQLDSLDEEIKGVTQSFSTREFITFHPAWTYFAKRYGLVEAAVIEEAPGKEPTIDEQRRIIDLARELKVKAIFAEPQFSTKAADAIAADSGAKVLLLDPIGSPKSAGKGSYIALMRYNVGQMGEAMR